MVFRDLSQLLVACSSLRSNTEPEDELEAALFPEAWSASFLNDSCDSDVEDELPPELVDNPGTVRGTKLSVLQKILFPYGGRSWPSTADPLIGVSVVFTNLAWRLDSKRFLEQLHG